MTEKISTFEFVQHLDELLFSSSIRDYAPNGLQIAGKGEISRVLTAVSASLEAIEAAIDYKADALLVHHGYFWKGEDPRIIGLKQKRISALLSHQINLIAYHLPLDLHFEYGNNILFGREIAATNIRQSAQEKLLFLGEIEPTDPLQLAQKISQILKRQVQVVASDHVDKISRIAWCSGAAQDFLNLAAQEGAQLFITGEYSERSYHEAKENSIVFFSCGHHATERFGVRALSTYIRNHYRLESEFYDQDNPF